MPTAGRLFVIIWAGGFILGGLIFAIIGFFQAKEAMDSGSWPSSDGKVISKTIDIKHSRDSDGNRETSYIPKIEYEFRVDDKLYRGDRLRIGQTSYSSKAKASAAMKALTQKSQCIVFYNPEDPETCTLEAGLKFHHVLFIAFGLLFSVLGIGGAWLMLSKTKGVQTNSNQEHATTQNSKKQVANESRPPQTRTALSGPRARTLQENITRWGREHIGSGDDTLVDWNILSSFDEQHLSYVEVEPYPNEVGYDKFIFVISFKEIPADLIATYCLEGGSFLLFSSNADADENLPSKL